MQLIRLDAASVFVKGQTMCIPLRFLPAALLVAYLPALPCSADTVHDPRVGAYRLADASVVCVGPTDDDTLRWLRVDGTTGLLHRTTGDSWKSTLGWTEKPDGKVVSFSGPESNDITFDGAIGHRIDFDVTETHFQGDGAALAGRLVLPKGNGPTPIVVLIHGADHDSALDFYALQRLFPSLGVGVFVYDKRGTGASAGSYSQDFNLLANDAVAAMKEARRLAGPRAGRVGYQGGSQGGWVAPLAANRAPVDFVIVSFGLAVSVLEEDRSEVALEMKLKGHTPAEIIGALEIAEAAETVVASGCTQGLAAFDAVRAKYQQEPWYKDVHGNFTWLLLPHSAAELPDLGKAYNFGTPWRYDPMPTLRASQTPQLWVLGVDDLDAPSAETTRLIEGLGSQGLPFTVAVFPRAEHGIYEYETGPDGVRVDTRNADGYLSMMSDFACDGRLKSAYGAALVTLPTRKPAM